MYSRPFRSECCSARIVGLNDEISTKTIDIEEEIRENVYLFAYSVNDLSHLAVLIIFN